MESPGHLLVAQDGDGLRGERSGLLELEALQSQLDARISQMVEAKYSK